MALVLLLAATAHAAPWPRTEDATGDWGGPRGWLDDHGLHIDLDYTIDLFGWAGGERALRYHGNVDLLLSLDSEKLGLWPGGQLLAYGQNGHGSGISDVIGARLLISNLEAPDFTQLSELWLAQRLGPVRIRLGKQDANRDFGGPRFTGNFVNSSFGVIPPVPMPTFPAPGLGVAATVALTGWLELAAGGYEGGPEVMKLATLDGGVFAVAAVNVRHDLRGRPSGAHTVGVWRHTGQDTAGVFAVGDLRLFASRDQADARSVQLFARAGYTPDPLPEAAKIYVGGGVTAHAFLGDNNTLGVGAGHARFEGGATESFLELFFKIRTVPWLTFEPDLQLYFTERGTDLFGGLRTKLKL